MKKYIILLMTIIFFSSTGSSQSLRKCGCQTWRKWNASVPVHEESRRERIKNYEKYKHHCIDICKQKKNK